MAGPILLYDGTCGFCAASVRFVLRNERRRHSLRFAPLDGPTAEALRGRHPDLIGVDSLVWFETGAPGVEERLLVRSEAALAAAAYLGGGWRLLSGLGRVVPRPLRDAMYQWVARHRHALGRGQCFMPSPATRDRFLDREPE